MEIVTEVAFTLGGGLTFKSQRPRCLRIFSIPSSSSIKSWLQTGNPQIDFQLGRVGAVPSQLELRAFINILADVDAQAVGPPDRLGD